MKNYDMFVLADQLTNNLERLKALKGAKFTYGLLKNIEILETEVKSVMAFAKTTDEFMLYDKTRIALCEKYAKKDDTGMILKKAVSGGSNQFEYDIDVESVEWKTAIALLREENVSVIETRDEQLKQYNELIEADSDIVLSLINLDDVPNDITLDLMKIIKIFVKE